MGVSPPSVSAMLDRLAHDGMVDYVHYRGVALTDRGRRAALRVIRRHRLLELYLTSSLGLGWDEVHEEAERLEHVLSHRLESAIDRALGSPKADPHGDPIPSADGTVAPEAVKSLWSVDDGHEAVVSRVSDLDPNLLRHLRKLGIIPGAHVVALQRESGGALRLRTGNKQVTVGREAAESVFVHG
jgi:DtxR family Mn-dependent transcriptional regulator